MSTSRPHTGDSVERLYGGLDIWLGRFGRITRGILYLLDWGGACIHDKEKGGLSLGTGRGKRVHGVEWVSGKKISR